ncbi:phage holin, lambda family [Budviciaceae bacterium BWR-B9]|uniref:Phage holin, lambda family n=3 Tax=Limnobaculum TaxID=2172100 RepID=A0A9D7AGC8_9GAMM|nr:MULTISPECIES: phage holin, lambda family [Limnobaculum]MBK5072216.1 phage holin, lambda family [Limnobaculum xujianqingii]MBK5143601.1 phage holin, lambda family [Limnobaculum allomyrinae]MBK5175525.1 phage holin, lambda family [Limnobaculum xujianqingii]MBV7691491.1 phage holin, lambda family [Limnobaculum sp. M2-1]QBH98428.1 phage holin, lambda family [Limnobaculum zhutongyuii]
MRMYKQPDIYGTIIAWIAEHRGELLSAVLAALMALLRGAYAGGGKAKVMLDAAMCSVIAWFIRDILMIINVEPDWALITSVFIGYLGTDFIGSVLKKLISNKSGAANTNGS